MKSTDHSCYGHNQNRHAQFCKAAPTFVLAVVLAAIIQCTALASQSTSDELGFKYTIVTEGPVTTVEIRIKPSRNFDTVTVEAASGVASLQSTCSLSSVVHDGSYRCRVDVKGKPSDAAMTINVIGQYNVPGGVIPQTEIHPLTLTNASYVRSTRKIATSKHVLTSSHNTKK